MPWSCLAHRIVPALLLLLALASAVHAQTVPPPPPSPATEQPDGAAGEPEDAPEDAAEGATGEGSSAPADQVETITIVGRSTDLLGIATSASEGRVGAPDLASRPTLRSGELLEVVPGLIATQHSGTGKANQYFLRGFNLDHGTDFAGYVEGVPINLPTHGHGQGYLDVNFLIPELVESIEFRKGTYYAETGDFSSTGYADYRLFASLPRDFITVGAGLDNFWRVVEGGSDPWKSGELLHAFEAEYYDGPWEQPEKLQKFNALLRYTQGEDAEFGYSISGLAYHSEWDSTDQIAERAVDSGLIDEFDALDDDLGGLTTRVGGFAQLWWDDGDGRTEVTLHSAYYRLNLFSNFTYFLDDPVNGDEFEQEDERVISGVRASHRREADLLGLPVDHTLGFDFRNDAILAVGLFDTVDRERVNTVRDDEVVETSFALYYDGSAELAEKLRGFAGVRGDVYLFDVESQNIPENSGSARDSILSPKAGLVLGPYSETEVYANWGLGYHSNDARGTTIETDPESGLPAEQVDPLVRSQGAELGVRTSVVEGLRSTVALWWLELDSELLFIGDAGNTEATGRSRRFGVEFANFYRANRWLALDLDLAITDAEYTQEVAGGGDEIPGAIHTALTAGATVDLASGTFGALRLRHFGPRELVEDGSVDSDATTLVNMQVGYRRERWSVALDILNLLDSGDDDITYFYTSRLAGEPAGGVDDIHFHPVEPLTARLYFTLYY